ncbi:MAG: hypothetical protein JSS81_07415 [Acidobacteria bacterium]|nr:hypothetical protein [Acidobacteriota bacterium]
MNKATQSQAIGALPPGADARALVPVDGEMPDSEYKSLVKCEDFAKWMNRIADYADAQSNSPLNWERRRKTVKLRKQWLGYYYGIFDKQRGFVSGKEEGDGIYFEPQIATFLETILAPLVKTKPVKECAPTQVDSISAREAARVAQSLLRLDDERSFTPKKQQREWKWNLLAGGETYRITYFNPSKTGAGVAEEVYEEQVIEGGDKASYCPLCSGTATDEHENCLNCGNPQMDVVEAVSSTITVKKGLKFKQIGDVDDDVPDCLEMTVIGETDNIAEALVVMRDRMIPRCVLEDALGIDDLPSTDTPQSLNYKQLFTDDRVVRDQNVREFELLHYQELWISPAVYTAYKFPTDTKTESAVIPAGTRAKDLFPQGLYFSRVKKRICELFPQGAGECLSHAVNSVGEGFHGQGEWDLSEQQDQLTEAHSMKMNSMLLDSTQPLLVREGIIDTENFENKFGLIVPVSQDFPMEQPLENLMMRTKPATPPQEAYQIGEEIRGSMQQRVGAFSTQSNAPDVEAMGTATGVATITQQTLERRAPALQLYAQMEVEQAYQKLELRQKNWCKKMYAEVARDLGDDAIKWFMQCNIRQDIRITVAPDSWMPRLEQQKQADFGTFMRMCGEMIALKNDPKMIDDVLRKANEIFGGGIDFNDYEQEATEAQLRLDALKEVAAFVEKTFGPKIYLQGQIAPQASEVALTQTAEMLRLRHPQSGDVDMFSDLPLDAMFDTHSEFTEAYTDWLKSAEGRAAGEFLRTLVWELADYHNQAEGYRQMKLKEYALVAQKPDLEAALIEKQAMEGGGGEPAPPPEPPPVDPNRQMELERQSADAEAERAHQLEIQQREAAENESAREHARETAQMEADEAQKQRDHEAQMNRESAPASAPAPPAKQEAQNY